MSYEELCKYVFSERRIDWNLHNYDTRKREVVRARQISLYLANWFWPHLKSKELMDMFNLKRCGFTHAINEVKNLSFSDKRFRKDIDKYLIALGTKIRTAQIVNAERLTENVERLKRIHIDKKLIETIDSMEMIAKVYCHITNKKLTDK